MDNSFVCQNVYYTYNLIFILVFSWVSLYYFIIKSLKQKFIVIKKDDLTGVSIV